MHNDNVGRSYYELQRPEIARLILGAPKHILEIGCAGGCFKNNISWNCEYHGVEPIHDAAENSRKHGIVIHEGDYQDVADEIPDNRFELIVCNDVIEHMQDPWWFLRNIKRKLVPDGYLIGSVPNVRYLLNLVDLLIRRDWRYAEAGVLDYTHLRFFTDKSMRRLFTECGYAVDELRPSGPDRFSLIKKIVSPFFLPIGTDTLYMQMAFRVKIAANHCTLRHQNSIS